MCPSVGGGAVSLPCGCSCEKLGPGLCLVYVSTLSPRQLRAFPRTAAIRREGETLSGLDVVVLEFPSRADDFTDGPGGFTVGDSDRASG